jgi:hypothetical protein
MNATLKNTLPTVEIKRQLQTCGEMLHPWPKLVRGNKVGHDPGSRF